MPNYSFGLPRDFDEDMIFSHGRALQFKVIQHGGFDPKL